jgi:hypothetical protein
MQMFTGYEYLAIDVANHHHSGLDKLPFEDRINWFNQNQGDLEAEAEGHSWKYRPMYLKAVSAVRKAEHGKSTGHTVGFDAICSGLQIMSSLTCCEAGARSTGLVDQHRRADAYTDCTMYMTQNLGYHISGERDRVKQGVMTAFYGSKVEPIKLFGKGTPELNAFYKAMYQLSPGSVALLDLLTKSWNPNGLMHRWVLPDGFDARVKVMVKQEAKIEVDELDHTTFKYVWYENATEPRGVKNAANVIHSVDAYVLRSLVRRCNYDRALATWALQTLEDELLMRALSPGVIPACKDPDIQQYLDIYDQCEMPDLCIINFIGDGDFKYLRWEHLHGLKNILETMLQHQPFEVITVHDDFKCHPNNMNHLRNHYRNILADLAQSTTLNWLLSQLYERPMVFPKSDPHLPDVIRKANYALC